MPQNLFNVVFCAGQSAELINKKQLDCGRYYVVQIRS